MRSTAQQLDFDERLVQWWWIQLPLRTARLSPKWGDALSDGLYLALWTKIAALAPFVALLAGFAVGVLRPGETYTQSMLAMGLMLGIGLMSAQLGAWTLLGYALGDISLHHHDTGGMRLFQTMLRLYVPLLLSYVLLGMLTVGLPLAGSVVRLRAQSSQMPNWLRSVTEVGAYLFVVAVSVYLWTQAVPVLIRPVYTWRGGQPPKEAIRPLQELPYVLILAAAFVCIVRVVLEVRARRSARVKTLAQVLSLAFPLVVSRRRSFARVPYLGLVVKAACYTFLLAGMISTYAEGLLVAGFLALVLWLRERGQQLSPSWLRLWTRVPLLLRFGVGLAVSYALSWAIVSTLWKTTETFQPVLISTCISIAVIMLLMISNKSVLNAVERRDAA